MRDNEFSQDIFQILEKRATCRNFRGEPIPQEVMEKLYAVACSCPSSGGFQRISIVAVKSEEKKKRLAQLSRDQGFVAKAPVNLVFCVDHRRMRRIAEEEKAPLDLGNSIKPLWIGIVDATIAAQSVALAAEGLGLRSCYNGNIIDTPREMSELLQLPFGVVPAIMLTLGYPGASGGTSSKKYSPKVMVHEEVYGDMPFHQLYELHQEKFPVYYEGDEGRLQKLYQVVLKQRGEEFASACMSEVEKNGGLTAYQYWFGCFYNDQSRKEASAKEYVEYLKEQGFAITGE